MRLDPRTKLSAEPSEQNNVEDSSKNTMQHPGSKQRHNKRTMFGGTPRVCRGVQNMLPAYSDASLNAGERQTVARHLDVCATCRYELRLLARSEQALIGAASAVPMPGDLRAEFYTRLAATPRRIDRWRVFVPALAVCGLLLIASTTAYRRYYIIPGGSTEQKGQGLPDARIVAAANSAGLPHLLPRRQIARVVGLPESPAHNRPLRPFVVLAYQGEKQSFIPLMQKMQPVGGAARQAVASVFTGRRAELTPGKPGRHKEQKPQRIAAVLHPAFSHPSMAVAASKRDTKSNLPGQRNMQVALLTRSERNIAAPQTRHNVSLLRGEHSPSTDRYGLQTEAADMYAVQLTKEQRSSLARRFENNQQMSLSTTLTNGMERESVADAREGGAMGYDAPEMDGVSFQVKDAQRGFTAGTRSESRMQVRGGRQVLSVHLEDQDRSEPDMADRPIMTRPAAQPAQTTKTGSEKER